MVDLLRYVVVLKLAIEIDEKYRVSVIGPFKTATLADIWGLSYMTRHPSETQSYHIEAMYIKTV